MTSCSEMERGLKSLEVRRTQRVLRQTGHRLTRDVSSVPKTWPQGVITAVSAVIGSMVTGQVAAAAMAASMTIRWMWIGSRPLGVTAAAPAAGTERSG
jgi:hypothetical protein